MRAVHDKPISKEQLADELMKNRELLLVFIELAREDYASCCMEWGALHYATDDEYIAAMLDGTKERLERK
ncbi:MAG: hypothetical protein K2Y22_04290 [Candidatus Obscuribacterales bacterium]|nr:hypothetical protein [Candidatus Obscuribacterales bacterium]